ncbi:MAG TPA: nucleoside deaminase [Candidatus Sumerlaeota bacterium]|nr:nucleoside deaminase [Candidatus Sumerlaeota bacterium]
MTDTAPPFEAWMDLALAEAEAALAHDEVPVGCVIADGSGAIVARAHDARQAAADPLAHAELLALRQAAAAQGDWRLDGMTLVVTLEPCPMCAGSILMARIARVVFGARSPKWGAAGSRADWLGSGVFPHRPEVIGGIREAPCGEVLSRYFRRLRKSADEMGG